MAKGVDAVPDVNIDPAGRFKYILIKIKSEDDRSSKLVVRGYARCAYHCDIMEEVENEELNIASCRGECVGGGRIEHDPQEKKMKVFGYSQGYGRADHEKAVQILKGRYPDYSISWSNDGY